MTNVVKIKMNQYQKSLIKDALESNGVQVVFDANMKDNIFKVWTSYSELTNKLEYFVTVKNFEDSVYIVTFETLRDIVNIYIRKNQSWDGGGFLILQNKLSGFDRLIVYYTKNPEDYKSNAIEFLSLDVEVVSDNGNTINLLSDNPVKFEPNI